MFNKKKKTMYVPDEEVLAYNKSKKGVVSQTEEVETVSPEIIIEDTVVSEPETTVENVNNEVQVDVEIAETEIKNTDNESTDSVDTKTPTVEHKTKWFMRFIEILIPTKSDSAKTIIIKSVSIIAAIALICSCVYLVVYFSDLTKQDGKIDNIRNNYELNREDYTINEENQFSKFDFLKSQNSDIAGWITIPNTEVNNPFYQTDNNDFYVSHDMDKQSNTYGALFLDYRCSINPMSLTQNQIIYGHNMRFGAMFGTLDEYRNIEYFKNNPVIHVDSLYEKRIYKIFAIMIVPDTEDTTFGYSYSPYRATFTSDTDFMQWIEYSRQRSIYDTKVDVNTEDEIITLSTCCYDFENARFVLLGRLVREGESENINPDDIIVNEDVLYCKAYYDKKGIAIPTPPTSSEPTKK